jgi:hypothetical protein
MKFIENRITNRQTSTDLISSELKKSLNGFQHNIITKLEDKEPFKIVIEENANEIINKFKEFVQEMEINANFELTKTIVRKNLRIYLIS